jgi:hypothetical protein
MLFLIVSLLVISGTIAKSGACRPLIPEHAVH